MSFGENVPGYDIPVLNEREVRAAAGILFVLMFTAIQHVIYTWDFSLLKYSILVFLGDFVLRMFVGPRWSPTLILGRLLVRRQTPEYVGAAQKRFAWAIGLVLGLFMFVSLVVLNLHSPISGLICFICLIFLLCESAFGICLGCLGYRWIYRKQAQYCPGEVCEIKDRQPIQKTSWAQVGVLLAFVAVMGALVVPLKETFSQKPQLVLGMQEPPPSAR